MNVTLLEPANRTNIEFNSDILFRWEASRTLTGKECFEAVFWQGAQPNAFYGIDAAAPSTSAERTFNAAYEEISDWLQPGGNYSWGVLLIEDCENYQATTRRLVSDVRTITDRK